MKVLVTGATGNLGSDVVEALRAHGMEVRRGVRKPAADGDLKFDFADASTFGPALDGVDAAFLIAPPMDSDAPRKLAPFIEAAGDRYIVFNSAFGADQNEAGPLAQIEKELKASKAGWTIVRPNFFNENFSDGYLSGGIKRDRAIYLPAGEGKTSFLSTRDIAEVVAVALERGLTGKAFDLTGPEALDHKQVAALIGEAAGIDVSYHAIPESAMEEAMRGMGYPESAIQYSTQLYAAVRAGYTEPVTDDVENVLGRRPVAFRDWAVANAAKWR